MRHMLGCAIVFNAFFVKTFHYLLLIFLDQYLGLRIEKQYLAGNCIKL